jgi:hypothetical protein
MLLQIFWLATLRPREQYEEKEEAGKNDNNDVLDNAVEDANQRVTRSI